MEREPKPKFYIEEMQAGDIEAATSMRHESWLDTYVNEAAGVTREWIEARNNLQQSEQKVTSRHDRFIRGKAEGSLAAWVAKDEEGTIIGSTTCHIDEDGNQHLGSLYVDKHWHGKGIADQLMRQVLAWLDAAKPIELGVAVYNERAKAFYRRWGFEEIPGSETLFDDRIPEIMMVRKGDES